MEIVLERNENLIKIESKTFNFVIDKTFDIRCVESGELIDVEKFEEKMMKIFDKSIFIDIRNNFLLSFVHTTLCIVKVGNKYKYFFEI